ncbi:MAG: nucleotidyltransferase family protein [Gammaproteobacteria bacterium]|nr:nucleotidyltransferase family protein [Gammaproteobacteria bacterium]
MKPSQALHSQRSTIRRIVESHRARNARIFGSVLRGEDAEDSDLDLLVEPLPGATLFDLGAIQIELEEMLGVPVEVLTPGDLPEKFRSQVLAEAVPV